MTMKPIEILGSESVYCINEDQLKKSQAMATEDPASAPRIQTALNRIEADLSRNEQAALAFVLIDRLLKTTADA